MSDNRELVILVNKEVMEQALNLFLCLIAFDLFAYIVVHIASLLPNIISYYFLCLMKKVLLVIIVFFLIIYLIMFIFSLMQGDTPQAVLNKKGIFVKNFGFIPWEDISEFKTYSIGQCPENIGIRLKDTVKPSTFKLRSAIFWSKRSGYPPINIYNTSVVPNSEIVWFAQQFLKENDNF